PGEYPPGFPQPENAQDEKGVLHYGSRQLAASDRTLKLDTRTRQQFWHGGEVALFAAKAAMWQPRGPELQRPLTEVLDMPSHKPSTGDRLKVSSSLLNMHLWADIILSFHLSPHFAAVSLCPAFAQRHREVRGEAHLCQ